MYYSSEDAFIRLPSRLRLAEVSRLSRSWAMCRSMGGLGGIPFPNAAVIPAEDDVKDIGYLLVDAPVGTRRMQSRLSAALEAGKTTIQVATLANYIEKFMDSPL